MDIGAYTDNPDLLAARARRDDGHRVDKAALTCSGSWILAGFLAAWPRSLARQRRDRHHGRRQRTESPLWHTALWEPHAAQSRWDDWPLPRVRRLHQRAPAM